MAHEYEQEDLDLFREISGIIKSQRERVERGDYLTPGEQMMILVSYELFVAGNIDDALSQGLK